MNEGRIWHWDEISGTDGGPQRGGNTKIITNALDNERRAGMEDTGTGGGQAIDTTNQAITTIIMNEA